MEQRSVSPNSSKIPPSRTLVTVHQQTPTFVVSVHSILERTHPYASSGVWDKIRRCPVSDIALTSEYRQPVYP